MKALSTVLCVAIGVAWTLSASATSVIKTVQANAADVSVVIKIIDVTDGSPETGVVFNTSGIDIEYWRHGANAVTDVTEATQTVNGAHSDGGFVHLGNGYYRVDLPDAAVASGVDAVEVMGTVTGMIVIGGTVQVSTDVPQTGDSFTRIGANGAGLSALPDVDTLLEALVGLGAEQTADSGTTTTIVDAALTQASDGWFTGMGVHFTSTTLLGQEACVTNFTASSDTLTFAPAVTTAVTTHTYYLLPRSECASGDTFARLGAPAGASLAADLADVRGDIPAALVGGRMDSSTGAMAANVMTATATDSTFEEEIETKVSDEIVDMHLDHLFAADYDPASEPGVAGAWVNEASENDGGSTRFTSQMLELAPTAGGGNMTQIEGVDATDAIDARIAAANILRPTTAGRTLDVTTTGEGGLDFTNVLITNAAPIAGIVASGTLSGTHSSTTADLGTNAPGTASDLIGHVLMIPGKFTSRALSAYDPTTGVATWTSTLDADVTLANGDAWYLFGTAPGAAGGGGGGDILTVEGQDATTYFETLDNPLINLIGTPVDLGIGGANLADNLQEIEQQTDDIGTAGVGLTNLGGLSSGAQGNIRTAVGLATANIDSQLGTIDDFVDGEVATIVSQTSAASLRGAVGLATANLDGQLDALPTAAEIRAEMDSNSADLNALMLARTQIIVATADSGDTNTLVDAELTFANAQDIDGAYVVRSDGQRCFIDSFNPATDTVEFGACAFTGAWSTQVYRIYPAGTQ